jgi:hypothetical protein
LNDLTQYEQNLPEKLEDLTKFVLVGQEKLKSVKAEIRAIDKLHIAKEVKDQKLNEAKMLSEALLTAQVRVGELTREIPKATQGNQYTGKMVADTDVANQKPKHEVLADIGITPKQAERYEQLAQHPEIVEQVKAEARETDELPTQTAVLNRIQQQKRELEKFDKQVDEDLKISKKYTKAIYSVLEFDPIEENLASVVRASDGFLSLMDDIHTIDRAMENLKAIKIYIVRGLANGKTAKS